MVWWRWRVTDAAGGQKQWNQRERWLGLGFSFRVFKMLHGCLPTSMYRLHIHREGLQRGVWGRLAQCSTPPQTHTITRPQVSVSTALPPALHPIPSPTPVCLRHQVLIIAPTQELCLQVARVARAVLPPDVGRRVQALAGGCVSTARMSDWQQPVE